MLTTQKRRENHARTATPGSGVDVGRRKREPDDSTYAGRVAARLRSLREEKRWSVEDMLDRLAAAGLKVAPPTYYSWENGRRHVDLDHIPIFAAVFRLKLSEFLPRK